MARKGKLDKDVQTKLSKYQYRAQKKGSDDTTDENKNNNLDPSSNERRPDSGVGFNAEDNNNNNNDNNNDCGLVNDYNNDNDGYHNNIEDNNDDDNNAEVDSFESKLEQVLDSIQDAKNGSKTKLMHWESLAKALITRNCFELLENRRITMQDIFERGLKRGSEEAEALVTVLSLVMITMGTSDFCDDIFRELYVPLNRMFLDPSSGATLRSKCATALSVGCFITDYGLEVSGELLTQLLSIAFQSPSKLSQSPNLCSLQANCLDMVGFLISIQANSSSAAKRCFTEFFFQLINCLESSSLPLRVASGELIALLLENCGDREELLERNGYQREKLCSKLHELATDNQKSRSKKDLREQRANFRQILRTVEGSVRDLGCGGGGGEELGHPGPQQQQQESQEQMFAPDWVVKVGVEQFRINSWQLKRYYDTFCGVLGSGINLHLAHNVLLRDVFDLGPVLQEDGSAGRNGKMSKMEKNYVNNFNRKVRKISRTRQRDRRHDNYHITD